MKLDHARHLFLAITAIALSSPSFAQLTLRLDPEADDPGTSAMPARFGHASSNRASGAAMQFALSYSITKGGTSGDFVYEPYAALVVNDNSSINTDAKALELGVKSVLGDLTTGSAWLVDASLARGRDRIGGTSSVEGKLSGELVSPRWLKYGLGYTAGTWGMFIRPKIGIYYLDTLQTDDPTKAPTGIAKGLSANLGVDLFLPFSDRMKISASSAYARDVSVSGARLKDTYRKSKAQVEYAFYNVASPPKGKTLFSLILERSIGRDALSTSTEKKASTGIYLGVKL